MRNLLLLDIQVASMDRLLGNEAEKRREAR